MFTESIPSVDEMKICVKHIEVFSDISCMTWPARRKGVINLVEAGVNLKQDLVWTVLSFWRQNLFWGRETEQPRKVSSEKKEERHNIRVETENVNNVALILEWWASFLGSHVNDVTLAGFTSLWFEMSTAQFLVTTLALPLLLHSSKTEWTSKAEWKSGDDGRLGDLYWNTSNPMWDEYDVGDGDDGTPQTLCIRSVWSNTDPSQSTSFQIPAIIKGKG